MQGISEFEVPANQSQTVYSALQLCRHVISREKHSRRSSLRHLGVGVKRSSIENMQVTDGILQEGTKMVEQAFITAQNTSVNSCFYTVLWDSAASLLRAVSQKISRLEAGEKGYHSMRGQPRPYTPPDHRWTKPRAECSPSLTDTGDSESSSFEHPIAPFMTPAIRRHSNDWTSTQVDIRSNETGDVEMLDADDFSSAPWSDTNDDSELDTCCPTYAMPGAFCSSPEPRVSITSSSINAFLAMNAEARVSLDPAVVRAHHEAIQAMLDRPHFTRSEDGYE
jgi:hypothetical protein